MYARSLVALDGSELAERILPHVEALAEQFGATVTLLQSITPVEHVVAAESGMPSGFVDPTPIVEEERHEAVTYLEAVAGRLRSRGPSVQCEQTEGTAAEAILGHARRTATELIALTTHGRGGLGRLVFGSVAEGVLRQALCPVLILRVSEGSAT